MTATSPVSAAFAALKSQVEAGTTERKYLDGQVRVNDATGNRGSYVEGINTLEATEQLLNDLDFVEKFEGDLPPGVFYNKARYFHAKLPENLVGRVGIKTFGSLTDDERKFVQLVDGAHGPELIMPHEGTMLETDDVWVIVGLDDGVMWTWYPGPISPRQTATLSPDIVRLQAGDILDDNTKRLIDALAVKLHLS